MLKAILVSLLFLMTIIFIFQNQQIFLSEYIVSLNIKVVSFENKTITNSLLLAVAFLLGVLICIITMGFSSISKSFKINQLQKKINYLEKAEKTKEVK